MQLLVCCILPDFSCMMTAPSDDSEMWCLRKLILKHNTCSGTTEDKVWEHLGPAVMHPKPLSKPLAVLENMF